MHVNAQPTGPKQRHPTCPKALFHHQRWQQRPSSLQLTQPLARLLPQPLARLLPASSCLPFNGGFELPRRPTSVGTTFSKATRAHPKCLGTDCVLRSQLARSLTCSVQCTVVALFFRTAMYLMMGKWWKPRKFHPTSKQQTKMLVSRYSRCCVPTWVVWLMWSFALATGTCQGII